MSYDPFAPVAPAAPAPAPAAPAPEPAAAPVAAAPAPVATETNGEVVVTLKGGAGYEAPWIVIHAPTAQAAIDQLDQTMMDLMTRTKSAAAHFSGAGAAPAAAPAQSYQAPAAPAGAQSPPPGAPACPPGWQFKSGVSKAGKPYQGYFPPRGDDSKPIFF